jgi:SprT protein
MFRFAQHDNALTLRFSKQLEFLFESGTRSPSALVGSSRCDGRSRRSAQTLPFSTSVRAGLPLSERPICLRRRDHVLESQARKLLRALGVTKLAREVHVEWNPRLKTCAGRADYREKLISLNPLLRDLADTLDQHESGADKLDRLKRSSLKNAAGAELSKVNRDEVGHTLRHELAHLLAQWRVGRRRIAPHGAEWRRACHDLGVADEARCHSLPFAATAYPPRYVYHCPKCREKFPRVRRIRRAIACLACCRAYNRGEFNPRFRLKLIKTQQKETKETKNPV